MRFKSAIAVGRHCCRSQTPQRSQRVFGLQPDTKIRIHIRQNDSTLCVDQIGRGNGQASIIGAVYRRDIGTEHCRDLSYYLRRRIGDAEFVGDAIAAIAQYFEREGVLLRRREGIVGGLRRDCDEFAAGGANSGRMR